MGEAVRAPDSDARGIGHMTRRDGPHGTSSLPRIALVVAVTAVCLFVARRAHAQTDTVRRDSTRRDTTARDRAKGDTARLPAMSVRENAPRPDRRMERARMLGGRIIGSKAIAAAAPTSRTLGDLMRRTAGAMVQVVSGYGGSTCLLVQRNVNLQQQQTCALLVVDDVVSMGDAYIAPTDVELIVVIPASAAVVRFGERGRFGAVAVYTKAGRDVPPAR